MAIQVMRIQNPLPVDSDGFATATFLQQLKEKPPEVQVFELPAFVARMPAQMSQWLFYDEVYTKLLPAIAAQYDKDLSSRRRREFIVTGTFWAVECMYKKWLPRILPMIPANVAPWQGICTFLANAAVDNAEWGNEWAQDAHNYVEWYALNKFDKHEGAGIMDADRLLVRTLYEMYWMQEHSNQGNCDVGGGTCPDILEPNWSLTALCLE